MNYETRYIALSSRVIAVAKGNEGVKDWAAYIDAVPGEHHELEWEEVMRTGEKLPEDVAKILFSDFAEKYTWRH